MIIMIGYIYKIHCNITGDDYYGSTTQKIEKRIQAHIHNGRGISRKCQSKQIIDRGEWSYEIMEEVDYIEKLDLLKRERFYTDNYPCINIKKPYNTPEEIKEMDDKKKKKYRSNPDNVRREREQASIKNDCECGGNYINGHRSTHLRTQLHKYYVENGVPRPTKEQNIECECGGKYQRKNKNAHDKCQRHKRFIDDN